MKNDKLYCLISVCSCFVKILKVYNFSQGMFAGEVVLLWQEPDLPISCYVVRKATTWGMLQKQAGYLRTSRPLEVL